MKLGCESGSLIEYKYDPKVIKRFEDKFIKKNDDECWEWTANKLKYGYFGYQKKSILAHRMSYTIYNGPIENKLCVRHTCDNPLCVNPNHLILGTNQENMNDKKERGRNNIPCGINHHGAKLTQELIDEILFKLENYKRGDYIKLAKDYNVERKTIARLHQGKTYKNRE